MSMPTTVSSLPNERKSEMDTLRTSKSFGPEQPVQAMADRATTPRSTPNLKRDSARMEFRKPRVEKRNGLNALEVVEDAVVLIRGVDGIAVEAESISNLQTGTVRASQSDNRRPGKAGFRPNVASIAAAAARYPG